MKKNEVREKEFNKKEIKNTTDQQENKDIKKKERIKKIIEDDLEIVDLDAEDEDVTENKSHLDVAMKVIAIVILAVVATIVVVLLISLVK
ncbi:MAG: hypothetical protein GX682_04430 [Clostridiaceae bacterium]|nr:hypothetical protein [Clostridiaceae bacterium]